MEIVIGKFLTEAENAAGKKGGEIVISTAFRMARHGILSMPPGEAQEALHARHEELHKKIYGPYSLPLE